MDGAGHARLVYLLTKHQVRIPKNLARYIPGSEWLGQLHLGLGAAVVQLDVPIEQLRRFYEHGETLGMGSEREARMLLAQMADDEIQRRDLELPARLDLYSTLNRFVEQESLIEDAEVVLSDAKIPAAIPKFHSGFDPLDMVTGGLYQGLLVVMARSGTGKTSLMLTLMEQLVAQNIPCLFVENEIPQPMMLGRMKPLLARTKFTPRDRLICGGWTARDVLNYVREHPDPERVVFFDGPDVDTGTEGTDLRHTLARAYSDLVRVKGLSRLVVTSSQANRKGETIQLNSVAESWSKAWFADMIVGANSLAGGQMRLKVLKNRFGPRDNSAIFPYNLEDLSWMSPEGLEIDDW